MLNDGGSDGDAGAPLDARSPREARYLDEVARDAPVAWWRLGDPVGSSTTREELRRDGGIVIPMVAFGGRGVFPGSSAVRFSDGAIDVGVIRDQRGVDLVASGGPFTIELWINLIQTENALLGIMGKERFSPRSGFILYVDGRVGQATQLKAERYAAGIQSGIAYAAWTDTGSWHHVVVVSSSQRLLMYKDGRTGESFGDPLPAASRLGDGVSLIWGKLDLNGGSFPGLLAELAVYDVELST